MIRFNKLLNTRIIAIIVVVCFLSTLVYCPPAYSHVYTLRVPIDDDYDRLNEATEDLRRKLDIAFEKLDKKEAEIKAKMWSKDQLAYHLSIIKKDPDSAKVLEAMEAIADIVKDIDSEIIGTIEVPDNVRDIIIKRINLEKEDAMRGSMIYELNRWGFHVPAFRELTYKILEDWVKQPDTVEQVLTPIVHEDILDEDELVRFLKLIYPILSQDVNEGLIQEAALVLTFLLEDKYGYEDIVSEYLTSDQAYVKRLKFLTGYKKLPILYLSHEILYKIGLNPKWDPETTPRAFLRAALVLKQMNLEAVLTEEEMFLLAEQIKNSPLPKELLSDFFKGGARIVFVSDNMNEDVIQTFIRTLREALSLRSSIGLTHVALTLSPSQMINFQEFLDGKDSYKFTEILDEGLRWNYVELGKRDKVEEIKKEFREVAVQLRDAGVEFILFNAEPDLKGELVIDPQVQNLKEVFDKQPNARVLAYGNYFGWDLHNRGNIKLSSVVSLLADSLGGNNRVAVVLQDEGSGWEYNSMQGLHNLEEFLERHPVVESDFGLHLGETVIDPLRFDSDWPDTYGEAFDGIIFRTEGDEGGRGGRLLKPTLTPLGTKKIPVPVFTPVIDIPEGPSLQMTPAGGIFSLKQRLPSNRYLRTTP